HPNARRGVNDEEGDAGEYRADEEVGAATTEPVPSAVAHRADDRLHDEACDGPREPEQRDIGLLRAEVGVDGAHVGELQAPAELYAEEPEAHVPDLPEAQTRFLTHVPSSLLSEERPEISLCL